MPPLKILDKTPFPWFGRKQKVAPLVWRAFGNVSAYTEPFGGSAAVLLARPKEHGTRVETYNDDDGLLVNFWRAVKADPEAVAHHCSDPPHELTKHARHKEIWAAKDEIKEKLRADSKWYNAEYAGHWVWGQCISIGGNWQSAKDKSLPVMCPCYNATGLTNFRVDELATCQALGSRLKDVRVTCGDWSRVLSRACLNAKKNGDHGIFLDPPYSKKTSMYSNKTDIAEEVARWAIIPRPRSTLRIVSCGYVGDSAHNIYRGAGWRVIPWRGEGGYANKPNAKERLYLSPHCLDPDATPNTNPLNF